MENSMPTSSTTTIKAKNSQIRTLNVFYCCLLIPFLVHIAKNWQIACRECNDGIHWRKRNCFDVNHPAIFKHLGKTFFFHFFAMKCALNFPNTSCRAQFETEIFKYFLHVIETWKMETDACNYCGTNNVTHFHINCLFKLLIARCLIFHFVSFRFVWL